LIKATPNKGDAGDAGSLLPVSGLLRHKTFVGVIAGSGAPLISRPLGGQ